MTNEPMVPLSEICEALENDTVLELITRHTPLPEPLQWSIARDTKGHECIITRESPDESGFVGVISVSSGNSGEHHISKLTFTGERMVRVSAENTPEQPTRPEPPLEAMQDSDMGLLGKQAMHENLGLCVVASAYSDDDDEVEVSFLHNDSPTGTSWEYVPLNSLTFNDEHPEYLETEEEYVNAPVGTVVTGASEYITSAVFQLYGLGTWGEDGTTESFSSKEMAGTRRRVLRWGKEK